MALKQISYSSGVLFNAADIQLRDEECSWAAMNLVNLVDRHLNACAAADG